ncbi:replication protein A 70 kDa DNA-binding subunit D-like [Sorghum bicolor]|uniref:replication protein A 70 kDa DNA-binding subunit D-like n=1 Tax=Sorghum bicolor TaxID=4558 RepID=UPI000B424C8C|nr:replication protein A 70 kDa DNA-binding subunit D-like [Sorghum bicolor]|eukprot:XP_021308454.1 replication protein A 70 kDa DNA-binding subunit D-like [Sorghum bicolor]
MIKLNKRTQIRDAHNQPPDFPKYTFSLIPIEKLLDYAKSKERFLDVIGRITGVSNAAMVSTSSGDSMMRRVVHLQDLKGSTIELSLSGKRAIEFDGETILQVGQEHHVIAIFVGTLMKTYKNDYKFLSGTSACRWYINQNDIPEIKAFQRCLPAEAIPIQKLYLRGADDTQQNFEKRTMLQLKDVDPFTERAINYECTATIVGITEQQTWCYQACKACNSRIKPFGQTYQCTKQDCPSIQFEWKYKIPYIASDEIYSLEFMFFEKKGTELIGKSAETLRKKYNEKDIPPEISSWIGHKFIFLVKILPNKSIGADDPSFEVIRIKEKLGKQSIMPVSKTADARLGVGSSSSPSPSPLVGSFGSDSGYFA